MRIPVTAQKDARLELLKTLELFSQLREYELSVIAQNSELVTLTKGQPLFSKGEAAQALYALESGRVGIISGSEGDDITIAQIFPGETFGETDYLSGGDCSASAIADTDSVVLRFPASHTTMAAITASQPDIWARILIRLAGIMAARIHTARVQLSEQESWVHTLRKQLLTDKLTALYNQTFITEDMDTLLRTSPAPTALLMIKPDNFKDINDSYGHEIGDRALVLLAIFLQSELDEHDIAIRFKGDEFSCILPGATREEAIRKARAIGRTFDAIDLSKTAPGCALRVRVSIGIALYPDEANDAETMVHIAHERMFCARRAGGNRIISRDSA